MSYVDITDYCKPLSNNISLLLHAQKIPIDFNPVITSSFVKFSRWHKASKLGLFLACKIPALCNRFGWLFFCLKVPFFFPGKSLGVTHSSKIEKSVFYFFRKSGKKNTCFFFPEKVHEPLTQKFFSPLFFVKGKSCLTCFFYSDMFWSDFVFFS